MAAPDAAVAVGALRVLGVVEALAEDAPLHREVLVVVERGAFVHRPAHRAVVEDDVGVVAAPDAVFLAGHLVAQAEAHEADDHVVGVVLDAVVGQADAVARRRLAGDGDVALGDGQAALELDDAGHVEDDGPGAGLTEGVAERSLVVVVLERGDVIDRATAAAGREHAAALGAREGARDAVFLGSGDEEVFIFEAGGRGRRGRFGLGLGRGRDRARPRGGAGGGNGADDELIGRTGLQVGDHDVAAADRSLLDLGTALVELPVVGRGARDGRPLEGQRSLRRTVEGDAGRDVGRLRLGFGFRTGAGGDKRNDGQQESQLQQVTLHSFSYSSAAQMSGPMPLGSLLRTFSWI